MESQLSYASKLINIQSKIPDDILSLLKKESNYTLKNEDQTIKYNKHLAGNIEKEFSLEKYRKILEPIIYKLAYEFIEHSDDDNFLFGKDANLYLKDIWINFQKKYEFNPLHDHSGIFSFVLWIQIPYDLEEELNLANSKNSRAPSNSLFEFVFADFMGKVGTSRIYVDKSYEGTIMLFPSSINHLVYPFYTSDEYRISISGNLIWSGKRKKNNIINYQ